VDWNGVMTHLPESFNKNDYAGEKELIRAINAKQFI